MSIKIREIERQDYAAVAEINHNEIWNGAPPENFSKTSADFFDAAQNKDGYVTFVALLDANVVGFISAVRMRWIGSENLFIQCFAVAADHQNKGIGGRLLRHIEEHAQRLGITGTGLQSGVQRLFAHAFYERCGYTKSSYFYKNFR